jgi:hypothetical protein
MRIGKQFNTAGNEGRLRLQEERINFFVAGMTNAQWNLALNPTLPLALRINGGVGNATLDLRALNLTALDVDGGVGTIRVNAPARGNVTMRLNGGVGNLYVTIPEGVAARIRVDKGLGALRVDETRFPNSGNAYQSADFANAPNQIDLKVAGGVGTIEVR